jgi:hypothetical protein
MAENHMFPGALTAVYTSTQYTNGLTPRVGDTFFDQANVKKYIFLKVKTGSSSIPAKTCAVALTTSKTSLECELPAATNNLPFAGARVTSATTIAADEYGWFQIGGSATLLADAAGTTAEAYCTTSNATAGRVEALASTAAVDAVNAIGIAETTTTTGDVVVILNKNLWGI